MDNAIYLPIFRRPSNPCRSKGEIPVSQPRSSSPSAHKWIHAVPVIIFLSFFILWHFSNPVSLVIKDGRIAEIHPVEIHHLNDSYVELAILASATLPIDSSPLSLTRNNGTEALPVNKND
ncbi:hypothetical protein AB3S75_041642 [Citrus x aurantiifolia]